MITEITVSNYRSFGADVHVKLGRLTALIGPNGAGKSNVTDVFKFLAESLIVGLEAAIASRHGIDVVRRWSSGRPFNLSVRMNWRENLTPEGQLPRYHISASPQSKVNL
jgi:AAA15 family ATPase/GTPase